MHYWWMPTDRPTLELHAAVLAVPAEVFKEIGPFNPNLSDTVSADYRYRVMQKGYEVRITAAVCGRADHDSTLRMILRKVFRRARVSAMEWARGETPGDSVPRAFGGVLLLAAVPALALPLLFGPLGALVSPLFVAAAVVLDGSTYRRVFARRGLLFGLYFSAVHLLVTLVGATGAGIGVLQRVLGGGGRALSGSPGPVTWRVNNAGDRDLRPSHDLQVLRQTRHDRAMAVPG